VIQFVVALWILILVIQLLAWAWPVTLGLVGLAVVGFVLSLAGRRGRIVRRRAGEIEMARQNASSQLEYERRQTEGRMWEELGRQLRGDGS
jgi:hypothetical protein